MSTSKQVVQGPSTDKFTAIFNIAENEYRRLTGKDLRKHPFAAELDTCRKPEDISNLLQAQAQAFSKFSEGDKKLMKWLGPTVNILFTFSVTLEGVGIIPFSPAKTIFTGIGVLLGAVRDDAASHESLIQLFERIRNFLQRLERYIRNLFTDELTELLGKIMAQLLSILALSTKVMLDGRIKNAVRRLAGRTDIEDAVSRLDALTKDENLVVVAKSLELLYKAQRDQLRRDFRTWLSPPDPSVNHNTACKSQHSGTCKWFIEGSTYRAWKKGGSLLWIRGNPGAGKSVFCSAVIEDVKKTQNATPASIAYYYFDYKDVSKRDVHGLLASLLFQLGDDSDRCWDALHELYKVCRDGSDQPSDAHLAKCLETMVEQPGQGPIFVIIDALDECPSTTGTPSAREEVLDFVEDLVGSKHANLFICVTSRPEQDIRAVLNPLTSPSCRVSLHEEDGQSEDINSYIRSFVDTDRKMRRWREEDRELVITALSERAGGMFRWVFCQLDTLRRCMPSSIRKALEGLPTTLDDTYERMLQGIPKEQKQHAHHLFQCLVAASRPLRVEELAEIFAIEFDKDTGHNLMENWRPENPEEAVLSTCSTLIAIIDNRRGSKIVQFSHFSVKEFLTSDRLRSSAFENIRHYFIPFDAAHSILVRACITVLLQLDENVDKERLAAFPLAFYAAEHWVDHAKLGDVPSQVRDAMEHLFDPRKPYLAAWACWIRDLDWGRVGRFIDDLPEHPPQPKGTALYYAALCGSRDLAEHLIVACAEDANVRCGRHGSPLHAAVYMGHLDTARVLLDRGADVNLGNQDGGTPLVTAYNRRNLEAMALLLERGANPDVQFNRYGSISHDAADRSNTEVIELLLQHKADVHIRSTDGEKWTLLHYWAVDAKFAQILLDHGADINALDAHHNTPLYSAAENGCLEHVRVLLGHGADVHIRGEGDRTPFQVAKSQGWTQIAQLLLEHGAEDE